MTAPIAHSSPWITSGDHVAVATALGSGMIGQGRLVRELEKRLAKWVGAEAAVATGSATAALLLALRAMQISIGDDVILPSYVCPSVLDAVISSGATPVLCDVGENWVVRVSDAARVLTRKTKAVIVPHQYGIFADVASFQTLGVFVIEDCAQALGAEGSRAMEADASIYSFHPTKCITSGEGGMVATRDLALWDRLRTARDGSRTSPQLRVPSPLSDIAAALALSQLDLYPEALDRRKTMALRYINSLRETSPHCVRPEAMARSMFFRFPVRVEGGLDRYQSAFLKKGVHVRRGVDLLLHRTLGLPDKAFPHSVDHFNTTVSLPLYPALTTAQESLCVAVAVEVLAPSTH